MLIPFSMSIDSARDGLPYHLFSYVSTITPLVNIDILLVDYSNRILLSWRDDGTYGPGWHIPGGVVRFKENLLSRVSKVCSNELSIDSISDIQLIQVNQIMNKHRDFRGHFLSFLFVARCDSTALPSVPPEQGTCQWFDVIPHPVIPQHARFIPVIESILENHYPPQGVSLAGNLLSNYSPADEISLS